LKCRKEEGLKKEKVLILNKKHYLEAKCKCTLTKDFWQYFIIGEFFLWYLVLMSLTSSTDTLILPAVAFVLKPGEMRAITPVKFRICHRLIHHIVTKMTSAFLCYHHEDSSERWTLSESHLRGWVKKSCVTCDELSQTSSLCSLTQKSCQHSSQLVGVLVPRFAVRGSFPHMARFLHNSGNKN
jgi:hypothetical protein